MQTAYTLGYRVITNVTQQEYTAVWMPQVLVTNNSTDVKKETSPNFEPTNRKYFVTAKHKFTFYVIPSSGSSTP
jgi:hypothetical protein